MTFHRMADALPLSCAVFHGDVEIIVIVVWCEYYLLSF